MTRHRREPRSGCTPTPPTPDITAGGTHESAPRSGTGLRRAAVASCILLAAAATALLASSDPRRLNGFAARRELARIGASYEGSEGVVLQVDWNDCGPAALANLMVAAGAEPPPLDSLEVLAGTGPIGTPASGLIKASEALGLPMAFRRVGKGEVADVPLPFIAWVNRSHFVAVVRRSREGTITVVDPSVGRYTIGEREFRAIWSGEAVVLAGQPDVRATSALGRPHFTQGRDTPCPKGGILWLEGLEGSEGPRGTSCSPPA